MSYYRRFSIFFFYTLFLLFLSCIKDSSLKDSTLSFDQLSLENLIIGQSLQLSDYLNDIPQGVDISYKIEGIFPGVTLIADQAWITTSPDQAVPNKIPVRISHTATSRYRSKELKIHINLIKIPFDAKPRTVMGSSDLVLIPPLGGDPHDLDVSYLIERISSGAILEYQLKGGSKKGITLTKNGVLSVSENAIPGPLAILLIQKPTQIQEAGSLQLTARVKHYFSVISKGSLSAEIPASPLKFERLDISKNLLSVSPSAKLEYNLVGAPITGVSVDKSTGVLSVQGTTIRSRVAVIVSQSESVTHTAGSITVEITLNKKVITFAYDESLLTKDSFVESGLNDGTLKSGQKILVTLSGENFALGIKDGTHFTERSHYDIKNVPAGLDMRVLKVSSTQAEIYFSGKAVPHTNGQDVSNVEIVWKSAALDGSPSLSGGVGVSKRDISFDFSDAISPSVPSFAYTPSGLTGGKFVESALNDGTLKSGQKFLVTLSGGTFLSSVANNSNFSFSTHYTVSNVPLGLAMKVEKKSGTTAEISFIGKAAPHTNGQDVSNVEIVWKSAALDGSPSLSGGVGVSKRDISFDFSDAVSPSVPSFAYTPSGLTGGKFVESALNDGTLKSGQKFLVTLSGGAFSSSVANNSNFSFSTHYTVSNVPLGLAMKVEKKSGTTAEISFIGKAAPHTNSQDVSNVEIVWKSAALDGSPSLSGGVGTSKRDISFDFSDAVISPTTPLITYTPSGLTGGKFVESALNDGTLKAGQKVIVNISGGAFSSAISDGDPIPRSGVLFFAPNSQFMDHLKITKESSTRASIEFSTTLPFKGHDSANDTEVIVHFLPNAFEPGPDYSSAAVNTKLLLSFDDPAGSAFVSAVYYDASTGVLSIEGNNFPPIDFTSPTALTTFQSDYDLSKIKIKGNKSVTLYDILDAGNPLGVTARLDITNSNITTTKLKLALQGMGKTDIEKFFQTNGSLHYVARSRVLYDVELEAGAFTALTKEDIGNVVSITGYPFAISYADQAPVTASTFEEEVANNGTFDADNKIIATVTGYHLAAAHMPPPSASIGGFPDAVLVPDIHYTVSGLPKGVLLQLTAKRDHPQTVQIIGAGTGSKVSPHTSAQDATATITFLPAAFHGNPTLSGVMATKTIKYKFRN